MLHEKLKLLSRGLAKKPDPDGLHCFHFHDNYVYTYNGEMIIQASCEEKLDCSLDGKALLAVIKDATTATFTDIGEAIKVKTPYGTAKLKKQDCDPIDTLLSAVDNEDNPRADIPDLTPYLTLNLSNYPANSFCSVTSQGVNLCNGKEIINVPMNLPKTVYLVMKPENKNIVASIKPTAICSGSTWVTVYGELANIHIRQFANKVPDTWVIQQTMMGMCGDSITLPDEMSDAVKRAATFSDDSVRLTCEHGSLFVKSVNRAGSFSKKYKVSGDGVFDLSLSLKSLMCATQVNKAELFVCPRGALFVGPESEVTYISAKQGD